MGSQVEDVLGGLLALGDRLGPVVWQFDSGPARAREVFEGFVASLPHALDGRGLRHVLDVRDRNIVDPGYVALALRHGVATVFTDADDCPSFADVTADSVYARLMRARGNVKTGTRRRGSPRWPDVCTHGLQGLGPMTCPGSTPRLSQRSGRATCSRTSPAA